MTSPCAGHRIPSSPFLGGGEGERPVPWKVCPGQHGLQRLTCDPRKAGTQQGYQQQPGPQAGTWSCHSLPPVEWQQLSAPRTPHATPHHTTPCLVSPDALQVCILPETSPFLSLGTPCSEPGPRPGLLELATYTAGRDRLPQPGYTLIPSALAHLPGAQAGSWPPYSGLLHPCLPPHLHVPCQDKFLELLSSSARLLPSAHFPGAPVGFCFTF